MLLRVLCAVLAFCSVRCQNPPGEIAFSAGLTSHASLNSGDLVVYDRLYSNVGAGYHSESGKFVCPKSGVYVFQVHALTRSDSDMWLELRHNFKYIISIWGHTDETYASGGNAVILQLTRGDEVYVECVEGYHSELYGLPSEVYSTFSGYLISAISDEIPGIVG